MLRWANPSLAFTWEEESFKQKPEIAVGVLKNPVAATPQFANNELDAIANLMGYNSAYDLELQDVFTQEFRTYQANNEDLVAERRDTTRKSARSRCFVRCGTLDEKYFYARVRCLFTLRTTEWLYSLALIDEFVDVNYPEGHEDEFYGRVIPLASRLLSGPTCIHVADIHCVVGIALTLMRTNLIWQDTTSIGAAFESCEPLSMH
ncbi:hypothetical protein V1509DRAFT_189272 [Lipomyces kononenkoae]